MKGRKSHQTVVDALTILKNLIHRGACGCEENTGDGVGILIQKPHKFFLRECKKLNINLPEHDYYGAGLIFLPTDVNQAEQCQNILSKIIKEEGQTLLGWRDLPTDDSMLGQSLIVWAIAEGRSVASAVDKHLMGYTDLPKPV